MHFIIYKTTNLINNKYYIGKHKTHDLNDGYMGSGKYLGYAIAKHGTENFRRDILFECDSEDEMNELERLLVDNDFIAKKCTYNISVGGKGDFKHVNSRGKNIYRNHRETSRKNMAIAQAANIHKWKHDKQYRAEQSLKISARMKLHYELNDSHWLGRHHTEESKRKIGEKNKLSLLGSANGMFEQKWINDGISNSLIHKLENVPVGWMLGKIQKFDADKESKKQNKSALLLVRKNQISEKSKNRLGYLRSLFIEFQNGDYTSVRDFHRTKKYDKSLVSLVLSWKKHISIYAKLSYNTRRISSKTVRNQIEIENSVQARIERAT